MNDYLDEAPDEFEDIGPGSETENYVEPSDMDQFMLLSYLSSNPDLWTKCAPIIDTKVFDPENKKVVQMMRSFYDRNRTLPSKLMIRAETGVTLETPPDCNDVRVMRVVCEKMETFIRRGLLMMTIVEVADEIYKKNSEFTTQELMSGFEDSLKDIQRMTINRDIGIEVHESMGDMLNQSEEFDNKTTNLEFLDIALNGGVTLPSYNLVSAASGDGKSIWLQNMAVNYAELGYNVIFYSLELEPFIIMKRFAAMMTDVDINLVFRERDSITYSIKKRAKMEGHIQIKKFPMVGTTIADIDAHYNDLCTTTGMAWEVVCIDYVDVMFPKMTNISLDNIHMKDKYVNQEVNDFAHDPDFPKIVWSASQQVKGAQDEKNARQSGVSGGTEKVNVCDNLIIIKRTVDDRQEERFWGHVEKGRGGGKGVSIPFFWNSKTQRQSNGDMDLFQEANPFLFNKSKHNGKPTQNSKLSNDPLFKEQDKAKLDTSEVKQKDSETSNKILARLRKRKSEQNMET